MHEKPRQALEEKLLVLVRQFITELQEEPTLFAITLDSSLDRDLGIDSLGRVELFTRIEEAFAVHFTDTLIAETKTVNDILIALETAQPKKQLLPSTRHARRTAESSDKAITADTIVGMLRERAQREPERPHIYLQREEEPETIIRYGDLYKEAKQVAAGLNALSLSPGDKVAIMLPTCQDYFSVFFGTMLLRCVPVPIYPPIRRDAIEEYAMRSSGILNNAECKALVTFGQVENLGTLLRVFVKSLKCVVTPEELRNKSDDFSVMSPRPSDTALIQYTSGSTSAPKGVLLTHEIILANIQAIGEALQIKNNDAVVSWLPLYHDMGLIGSWLVSFYNNIPMISMSPLSFVARPERWLWAIHRHHATLSAAPNFAYELSVKKIDEKLIQGLDLSSWRVALNGAEAVNPSTIERFITKFAPFGFKREAMFPVFGLAESSVALTFPPLNRGPRIDLIEREEFEKGQRAVLATKRDDKAITFVSCGYPLRGHEVRIVDDNNEVVPERTIGHLHFRGPSSMKGYYRNTESTKAAFHHGFWDSGDLAYMADGEIFITGRKKDIIIKAGRNLSPEEIEEVASTVQGVRKGCVAAFGVVDRRWATEKLVIVAETRETDMDTRQQIVSGIIDRITAVIGIPPDEVVLTLPKSIPKTTSGKLQRTLCKQLYIEGKLSKRASPIEWQVGKLLLKGGLAVVVRYLEKLWRGLFTLYAGLLGFIFFLGALFLVRFFPKTWAQKSLRSLSKIYFRWAMCPISSEGIKNAKFQAPMVFVANHASYLDTFVLLAVLPTDIAIVGKKEIFSWPFIGPAVKRLGFLSVDRVDFFKDIEDTNKIIDTLKDGRSVLIFPEGTFFSTSGLLPFKLGAFKVAVETGIPICPIAIKGTRFLLGTRKSFPSPGPIEVNIGVPSAPLSANFSEVIRLQHEARKFIAEESGEWALDRS